MLKITERGWAGHFICADRCKFRRNTLVEKGEKRIVVSSVGLMEKWGERNGKYQQLEGFETIGLERYYETMVFEAQYLSPYWEADVTKEVSFESPWSLNECKHESDEKMNAQHDAVVAEIVKIMEGTKQ